LPYNVLRYVYIALKINVIHCDSAISIEKMEIFERGEALAFPDS
jgi:hypothetical protein